MNYRTVCGLRNLCLSLGFTFAALFFWGQSAFANLTHHGSHEEKDAPVDNSENWTSRYQMTYGWNRHSSFRSAYEGPNSLLPIREKMYTFSATAHWGWRPRAGTEIYYNPEAALGVPFSDGLIGLGSFTNGEITRAAGKKPKYYRQRLFLRETWNHGGESESQDSDFNQFAGSVDRRRTVLTLGNFSALDIFDDNRYAKDPRIHFMNWSNWAHTAWDYPADSRGFTNGFAVEFYRDDWVLRVGRLALPKEPNGLRLDGRITRHYGDQLEIERAHQLMGQPGKARLLVYRGRAVLARFDDATAEFLRDPTADPQAFFRVRNGVQTKYGAGINLEQAINRNTGAFLRAFKSDGRTETNAFTESDTSFSTGLAFEGAQWGRERDSVGVAVSANGISKQRRRYLDAGGISFFIGDGDLQYRPEKALEAYYSWGAIKNVWLTANYQRIHNPAYNSSRGPVDVFSFRFHAEY